MGTSFLPGSPGTSLMINLDTHILLYAMSSGLTETEREVLTLSPWGVSAIVLWEVSKLAQLGRISLDLDDHSVRRAFSRLIVWPITWEVAKWSTCLDFKSDPADELIAATSIVHQVPLLTRDARIRCSQIVPFAC